MRTRRLRLRYVSRSDASLIQDHNAEQGVASLSILGFLDDVRIGNILLDDGSAEPGFQERRRHHSHNIQDGIPANPVIEKATLWLIIIAFLLQRKEHH